jgi:hypothetical protein
MELQKRHFLQNVNGLLIVLIGLGSLSSGIGYAQTTTGTRLHQIDQLSKSALLSTGSTGTLAQAVIGGAYDSDLASSTALPEQLSAAQDSFLAGQPSGALTDLEVTVAFDAWRNLVADPSTTPTSPLALHLFRAAISTVAPSLITKGQNGLPSQNLSPAEAVYFFDFLIANGAVPPVTNNAAQPNTSAYNAAVAAYAANTTATQRQSDVAGIVDKYLLPQSN